MASFAHAVVNPRCSQPHWLESYQDRAASATSHCAERRDAEREIARLMLRRSSGKWMSLCAWDEASPRPCRSTSNGAGWLQLSVTPAAWAWPFPDSRPPWQISPTSSLPDDAEQLAQLSRPGGHPAGPVAGQHAGARGVLDHAPRPGATTHLDEHAAASSRVSLAAECVDVSVARSSGHDGGAAD
ncbi:hypothetical protein ON010_g4471 [Phytophthora cinnamomi]|nr:hypothetical protein ON010_g4471 [Phytophthora cinnamomi]